MPGKYRILDNGQGDASKPGPISSTTERDYPTRQQIAKAKTDKARFKSIKADSFVRQSTRMKPELGYKTNRTQRTVKIGPMSFTKFGTYKGAGSKKKK